MFNKMGKRKFGILVIVLIICGVFIAINGNDPVERPISKKLYWIKKESVFDESQFVFKPIFEQIGDVKKLKILCEITSYMNPEILGLNYESQTMLELNEDLSLPSSWKVLERSNYKIIGQLSFSVSSDVSIHPFTLRIFTYSDHEISWN